MVKREVRKMSESHNLPQEVLSYYERNDEAHRLSSAEGLLEFVRTTAWKAIGFSVSNDAELQDPTKDHHPGGPWRAVFPRHLWRPVP